MRVASSSTNQNHNLSPSLTHKTFHEYDHLLLLPPIQLTITDPRWPLPSIQ
jgi:hypothetical protein